jgi:hypothetical protein
VKRAVVTTRNTESKLSPFDQVLRNALDALKNSLSDALVSVVLYGSRARGTARKESDIDLLVVIDARGSDARTLEKKVHEALQPACREAFDFYLRTGEYPCPTPLVKSIEQAGNFSRIYLDMLEEGKILYDRSDFIRGVFDGLRKRLAQLGARRVWFGDNWVWDLKPDYKPGDIVEL